MTSRSEMIICPRCLGEYGPTMDELVEHIYHSPEHGRYINMMVYGNPNGKKWWEFWK